MAVLHRDRSDSNGLWCRASDRVVMEPLVHCVYVLFSRLDGDFYTGFSSNLTQRLNCHADGEVPSTAPRRPLVLVHVEYYLSEADARRREAYFKTTKGKRALKLMLPQSLGLLRNDQPST